MAILALFLEMSTTGAYFCHADSVDDPSAPSFTASQLEKLLAIVPFASGLSCATKDFMSIVQPSAYDYIERITSNNYGLDRFVSELERSKTFQEESSSFYHEVEDVLKSQPAVLDRKSAPSWISDKALELPTLRQIAGDKEHSDLQPGWLWSLALRHSQGNPNRAIELIGVCGNDDVYQSLPIINITDEEVLDRYKVFSAALTQHMRSVRADITSRVLSESSSNRYDCSYSDFASVSGVLLPLIQKGIPGEFEKALSEYDKTSCNKKQLLLTLKKISATMTPQTFRTGEIDCPKGFGMTNGTNFFLPQSLGKSVDISEETKDRIIHDQSMPGAQHFFAAKYYHVYGSALVACEMIARGYDPALVRAISDLAAWYYRAITLTVLDEGNPYDKSKDEHLWRNELKFWKDSLDEILNFGKAKSLSHKCEATPSDLLEQDKSVRMDAIELVRRWTISGDFGKLGTVDTNFYRPSFSVGTRPLGWSEGRFEKARARFDAMMDDFDWTVEQHDIGARFAIANCKPDPQLILKSACKNK